MCTMKFYTKPWEHQREALKYLMPREYGALYTTMGSGKTKIMVDLIINKGFKRTLIICPKKVCRIWPSEFAKHAPGALIHVLNVSTISGDKRLTWLLKNGLGSEIGQEIIVCNYDSVWREPFKSFLLEYKLDVVICDESHRIKTPGSKVSKFLALLGKRVSNRYLMTGTPLAQSPLDIYAQYRFLAPHIFGTRFDDFKYHYANFIRIRGGIDILNKSHPYRNLKELRERMFSCAFYTEANLDLPDTQDIDIEFDLPPSVEKTYKEFQREGCLELAEGTIEAGNVLTLILRLQQLVSGYLPVEDAYGGVKVKEIDDSRQLALQELLEDLPKDEPVVIFAKYTQDIKNIRKIVKKIERKSSEISGKEDTLDEWLEGKTTVLVAQIASGAEGIDLTRARYCVYYTLSTSLAHWEQSRKRVHRPGQTRSVLYYTLVAKMKTGKTIDEHISQSLRDKQSIVSSIMKNRKI